MANFHAIVPLYVQIYISDLNIGWSLMPSGKAYHCGIGGCHLCHTNDHALFASKLQ